MKEFPGIPEIPQELVEAAKSGELVVFIGAGISRLVGAPSWEGFAEAVLSQLTPEVINYHEKSLIDSIGDPRKKLSIAKILEEESGAKIDYKKMFSSPTKEGDVYHYINQFKCSFVTTNYDKFIRPKINSDEKRPETEWRFFECRDLLSERLNRQGAVVHLHGCVDMPETMVVTTPDYLNHYSSSEVPEFLQQLFSNKVILFLGYGLEETEILEYILKTNNTKSERSLFILQGFYNAEYPLFSHLSSYYQKSFNAELIGFPKDQNNFSQQTEIIKHWGESLSFQSPAIFDELAELMGELEDD